MNWMADLAAIGSIVAACGAVWAAVAATKLVAKTQTQVDLAQRELFSANRPLLLPKSRPPVTNGGDGRFVDLDAATCAVDIANVGTGVALNLRAVLFGPQPRQPATLLPRRRTAWLEPPMTPGEERRVSTEAGMTSMDAMESLEPHKGLLLYAPMKPTPDMARFGSAYIYLARMTMTYTDIYGRKHLAIFDFDSQDRWHSRGYWEDISRDLGDLEERVASARHQALTANRN